MHRKLVGSMDTTASAFACNTILPFVLNTQSRTHSSTIQHLLSKGIQLYPGHPSTSAQPISRRSIKVLKFHANLTETASSSLLLFFQALNFFVSPLFILKTEFRASCTFQVTSHHMHLHVNCI